MRVRKPRPPGSQTHNPQTRLGQRKKQCMANGQDYLTYPFLSSSTPSTTARSPPIAALTPSFPPSPLLAFHTYTHTHTHTTFRRSGSSKRRRGAVHQNEGSGWLASTGLSSLASSFFYSHHEEGCSTEGRTCCACLSLAPSPQWSAEEMCAVQGHGHIYAWVVERHRQPRWHGEHNVATHDDEQARGWSAAEGRL